MAERNRFGIILLPAFFYGGVISIAVDYSLVFFYDTNLYSPHVGIYFWVHTLLMVLWNLLWYPKLLWWWASDEFYYGHSAWKMTYKTAFFYSFCLQIINTLLTGLCIQKIVPDPYFVSRMIYTPCTSLCTLYFYEFMGLNGILRRMLMHDL